MMSGRSPRVLTELAAIHARRGERDAAEAIFQEVTGRARSGYIGWTEQGVIAAAAGRIDEALDLVSRGIAVREPYLLFQKSPAWVPFRSDPRGQAMLVGVGP
jgi:hypothetical protein